MDLILSFLPRLDLSFSELVFCCGAVVLAGCVRGFAGFGLSAVAMGSLVLILPPVELIPVLFLLEGSASLVMFRGGLRDADMGQFWPLAIGSALGVPLGLLATTSVSPELSKLIAVSLILVLTVLQFSPRTPAALATKSGGFLTGVTAGSATGLASVGGMVVALYVLANRAQPTRMRATLTLYLFIGMFTSLVFLFLYDMINHTVVLRAGVLIPFALAGVLLGTYAFKPAMQKFYRNFCLILLIGICLVNLGRISIGK